MNSIDPTTYIIIIIIINIIINIIMIIIISSRDANYDSIICL